MDITIGSLYRDRMRQVFLYITHDCNYSCRHCLVGNRSKTSAYDYSETRDILVSVQQLGAAKVTLLGGEPTTHSDLLEIIGLCKDLGFFVVLDTNGSFPIKMFDDDRFRKIDTLCFSVDGAVAEVHDAVRGSGSFEGILERIDVAQTLGMGVKFTHTVTGANLGSVLEMLKLAERRQINELNFHIATMNGRAKLISDPNIVTPRAWRSSYEMIRAYVASSTSLSGMNLRIPPRYCTREELLTLFSDHECIGVLADRMLILPCDHNKKEQGGPLYVCGLLIGEEACIGWNAGDGFIFNDSPTGEYAKYYSENLPSIDKIPVCPIAFGDQANLNYLADETLLPLCISYKPSLSLVNHRAYSLR